MSTAAPPLILAAASDLLLARLAVPSTTPSSVAKVREDVGKVLGQPIPAADFTALTDQLRSEGLVEPRPRSRGGVQLTAAGRARALAFLGVSELPPRTNWAAINTKYLLPTALGVARAEVDKLDSADRLTAFLLRREYDLSAGTTLARALEALICRQLGHPEETTLEGLYRSVLSAALGSDERLSKAEIVKQFPRKLTGAKSGKLDDLRQAIVRMWLRESVEDKDSSPQVDQTPVPPTELPFDLIAFAATVKRLARDCPPEARFGTNKAFIVSVWRESQTEDGFPRMPLEEFKSHLVEANRAGLLKLSRADLVQAMDTTLVAESETAYLNATFHFILIEDAQP